MRNFFSARSMVWRSVLSCLSVSRSAWTRRMPNGLGDMGPEASVMVDEAVEGVMGGGERGMPGDRGQRSLGPLMSMRNEGVKTRVSGAAAVASLPAEEMEEMEDMEDMEEMLEPVFDLTSFLKLKREDEEEELLEAEAGGDIVGEDMTEDEE